MKADRSDTLAADIRERVYSLLRMHGIHGLPLVDASIMTALMADDTHTATIIMSGEAADILRSTH